ncbi:type II toxin-antitoxin system RelE/ParE family toxin [Candidatus Woesearchaeota archaeon]|jgi:addiction module RelE/StbE family toxin|nr:type II toxin-antitoxin system RelE/ParE family toxin [Candidatus Woesearchaeota archaeon]
MDIIYSKKFLKEYRKIKDKSLRLRLFEQINKLSEMHTLGKPLRYSLKGHRSIRIKPFRVIYRLEEDKIIIICFNHRKNVY